MSTDPSLAYVWSFKPNWRDSFRVSRAYRTDIFTSRSKRETRRALRDTPKRDFEFSSVMDRAEQREFDALMWKAQDKPFIAPDWSRRTTISLDAAASTDVLTFDAVPSWLVEGRALFLWDRRTRPTAVYVDSIDGTEVTLTDSLADAWPAGSVVVPGPVGMFAGELRTTKHTNAVKTVRAMFSVEAGSEPVPTPAAAPVTHNGREVFTLRPNWAGEIDESMMWPSEMVDFNRGATASFRPFPFPSMLRRANFVGENIAAVQEIEDLFDRMKGQRGEFYMPTGSPDIVAKQALGGNNIRVDGLQMIEDFADSRIHKAICVRLRDGTQLYRTVTSIHQSLVWPEDALFDLDTPWPYSIPLEDVLWISWMPVYRFASDILTLDWLTAEVAQCELSMRSLEALPAETPIA